MKKKISVAAAMAAAIALISFAVSPFHHPTSGNFSCVSGTEKMTVSGDSLSGFIESGRVVTVLPGFYTCNNVEREDIVLYNYAGDKNPLIKVVKGIEGDTFGLQKTTDGWNLLINGAVVKNSRGEAYLFGESEYTMLSLYATDYKGVIPPHASLILGNVVSGSLDSSRFGLVDTKDIMAKVLPP